MTHARLLIGDVFDRMATLPDGSVDLVLTSPPFLALRSYLPSDHPDKGKEIGSEPTPAAFLDTLLRLSAEWRRLLAPHGSICVELGDTYSGSGGAGGDYGEDGLRDGQPKFRQQRVTLDLRREGTAAEYGRNEGTVRLSGGSGWPLTKSLCGIPHLYHLSLAYGRNLLTGEPSPAGQWRVRNVVAWCRPNPPVGALGDKFRPATSYLTVACVSGQRYFDLDAVRSGTQSEPGGSTNWHPHDGRDERGYDELGGQRNTGSHPEGAPPLDWWEIPTHPYPGSHYATWPPALCVKPILTMAPQRVCTTCGEPSRRIHEENPDYPGRAGGPTHNNAEQGANLKGFKHAAYQPSKWTPTGWTDCGHDTFRNGLVLDPFAGSGTTLAVATGHGRDAIGIDLDPRSADLCSERVGMFLDVDQPEAVA